MRFGGRSWNHSLKRKQGVLSRFKCRVCSREYKMEWARANHEKLCKEYHNIKQEREEETVK